MAEIAEVYFGETEYTNVELISGALPALDVAILDFRENGVRVEQHEPDPEGGYVRHVNFVPYSNLKRIFQGYLVEEE